MTKSTKIILRISLVIIIIVFIITGRFYTKRQGHTDFEMFDQAKIYGKIEKVGIKHHGTFLKITNDSREFIFYPNTSGLNGNKIFNSFAEIGDFVNKEKNSDTLVLIKKGMEFKFTFQKIE